MLGYELNICYTYLYKNNTIFIVGDKVPSSKYRITRTYIAFSKLNKKYVLGRARGRIKGCVCVCVL